MLRHQKVTEAIKREVSVIIHDELKDPRIGFVTITRVELAADLRFAKIFFSVLGEVQDYQKTKDALINAAGFIRRLIAQRIKLRFTPEIAFKEDKSCQHSIRIQQVLEELKEKNEPKKRTRLPKKA